MGSRLVDTHCHVQLAAFEHDTEEVITRAHTHGVDLLVVGTNTETSAAAVKLAQRHTKGIWAAIGIHPNHLHRPHHDPGELAVAPTEDRFDHEVFARLADSKKVVAVGETGLDYYRIAADETRTVDAIKELQRQSFGEHIRFARERSLPLIVHVRDGSTSLTASAHDDVQEMLRTEINKNGAVVGVIHCFSGSVKEALRYVALGFYISFTGTITYPPRKGEGAYNPLLDVVRAVPSERLLVETDSPYLSPTPVRGQRNEPANVSLVAEALATARGIARVEVEAQTTVNAYTLFNLAR